MMFRMPVWPSNQTCNTKQKAIQRGAMQGESSIHPTSGCNIRRAVQKCLSSLGTSVVYSTTVATSLKRDLWKVTIAHTPNEVKQVMKYSVPCDSHLRWSSLGNAIVEGRTEVFTAVVCSTMTFPNNSRTKRIECARVECRAAANRIISDWEAVISSRQNNSSFWCCGLEQDGSQWQCHCQCRRPYDWVSLQRKISIQQIKTKTTMNKRAIWHGGIETTCKSLKWWFCSPS